MDNVSKEKRSQIMAKVKSSGNKSTEIQFISILKEKTITGWRRNYPILGKPDFVFPRIKVVVFVDGCFWHGCEKHCRLPLSNKRYWKKKIENNKIRDRKVTKSLINKNWTVIRIWEHEIKEKKVNAKINRIINLIEANNL